MLLKCLLLLAVVLMPCTLRAQVTEPVDSDHDGLSDVMEDALLQRFVPQFMISASDCSAQPARFEPGVVNPTVAADDGTIYGQATPHKVSGGTAEVELHFYHLWRVDCGRMGHALDAEHVAVLLRADAADAGSPDGWRAVLWYSAAHEDTVCDNSMVARAAALHAETKGAEVWISAGKHGSFLQEDLCRTGCGGDRCVTSRALVSPPVVNLGEWNSPMDGAVWISSSRWPLRDKITRSDFPAARVAMAERAGSGMAWVHPGKRPAEAAILGGSSGVHGAVTGTDAAGGAIAVGGGAAGEAISTSSSKTGDALKDTGDALSTATRGTGHALRKSWHGVRRALGGDRPQPAPEQ